MTMHVSTPHAHRRPSRRVLRAAAVTSAVALSLLAAPARADVPEGWTDVTTIDGRSALMLLVGAPLLLFVLITLAVYLPAMVRGEKLLPDYSAGEGQWIGGPRQGVAELPAPDTEDSRAGGASGSW